MGRARQIPHHFGSREPESAAVCPLSRSVIMLCYVNLPCGEGLFFSLRVVVLIIYSLTIWPSRVLCGVVVLGGR